MRGRELRLCTDVGVVVVHVVVIIAGDVVAVDVVVVGGGVENVLERRFLVCVASFADSGSRAWDCRRPLGLARWDAAVTEQYES